MSNVDEYVLSESKYSFNEYLINIFNINVCMLFYCERNILNFVFGFINHFNLK